MQNFSCSALLRCRSRVSSGFRLRGFHPLWPSFPTHSANLPLSLCRAVLQPRSCRNMAGLGSCAFARHYLRNHWFVFSSSGYLDVSVPRVRSLLGSVPHAAMRRVAPFGNPRFYEYLPLGAAYRSLSRPSSPPRAKASFMCPFLLSFY